MTRTESQVRSETQDSQAILEALRAELLIGAQTSSHGLNTSTNHPITVPGDESLGDEIPDSCEFGREVNTEARDSQDNAAALNENGVDKATKNAPARKMDVSQQTPTQINEDRDYDEACGSLPSSSARENAKQTQNDEERTLQEDDTGAVNFGDAADFGRPSSQVSEDGGFDNTRGDWRRPGQMSEHLSSHGYTPFKPNGVAPETPALPKNPFGAKPSIAAPLAGSQLFGQTQFSSAVKPLGVSPTSSRPSPNIVHNSISPNVAETSPLKDRTNVSSPTEIRTSSPQRLEEVPATVSRPKSLARIAEETPTNTRSTRDDTIPGSPTNPPPGSSGGHQPLAHYENMKMSQERKVNGEAVYDFVGSDSEDDTTRRLGRRRRVEKKKAQAAQEMEKVSFTPPPRRNSNEKPSRKRRCIAIESEGGTTTAQLDGLKASDPSKGSHAQPLVADSQKRTASSNQIPDDGSTQGTEDPGAHAETVDVDKDAATERNGNEQLAAEDRIPATSPASSSINEEAEALPQSEPDLPRLSEEAQKQSGSNDAGTSSLPPARKGSLVQNGRRTRAQRRNTVITSSASELPSKEVHISTDRRSPPSSTSTAVVENETDHQEKAAKEDGLDGHAEPEVEQKGQGALQKSPAESSAPMATRSRRKKRTTQTPLDPGAAEEGLATSSSLSTLSSAPPSSAMTTPVTRDSPGSERGEYVNLPSPVGGRSLRKRALRGGAKSVSPQPVTRHARAAKQRPPQYGSESTDELRLSPSGGALEKSMPHPRASRTFRHSIGPAHRGNQLFEGMAFAISFQSNRAKPQDRTKLEAKIAQAGGMILPQGFEEIFEQSPVMGTTGPVFDQDEPMTLSKKFGELGFTALIADGHSRKAKHMQALALGLPCLAHQWVTACLNKGELVDWEPYLLCSGSSAVLGNAVRSRNLTAYPAGEARLAEVVDQRRKLLEGQRILVVVDSRKARNEAKQPYIFLAQALGPSISRVFTTEQARDVLTKYAQEGQPFDWVYVDTGSGTVESVLCAPEAGGKKRKRKPAVPAPLLGNTRVLNDELVIQSLILGRMVEGDEVNF